MSVNNGTTRNLFSHGGIVYAPCKGCTERTLGCHSSCEKYAKYKGLIKRNTNYYRKQTGKERAENVDV